MFFLPVMLPSNSNVLQIKDASIKETNRGPRLAVLNSLLWQPAFTSANVLKLRKETERSNKKILSKEEMTRKKKQVYANEKEVRVCFDICLFQK